MATNTPGNEDREKEVIVPEIGKDGIREFDPLVKKEPRKRIKLPVPELGPNDFFPPIAAISETQVRSLKRRHMIVIGHHDPRVMIEPTICLDPGEQTPRIPNTVTVHIYHGRYDAAQQPEPAHVGFYGFHEIKTRKPELTSISALRETRVTNGLDPDSLDPKGPHFLDKVSLLRLFRLGPERVPGIPPGTSILIKKQRLMLHLLNPRRYVEARDDGSLGPVLRFSCPDLLEMFADSLDSYYEPLREYENRDLTVANLPNFKWGEQRKTPPNPYELYLRKTPSQRAEKLKHVLSTFDPDYLLACLPLEKRTILAARCHDYQRQVRKYLEENSRFHSDAFFPRALEETLRNSERIIRGLIELMQLKLEEREELTKLPVAIEVPGDLIDKRFLGGTLAWVKLRDADGVTLSKDILSHESSSDFTGFLEKDPPETSSSIFALAAATDDALATLHMLLGKCKVNRGQFSLFERAFRLWQIQKRDHPDKRENEKRLNWAEEKLNLTLAKLPSSLRDCLPTYAMLKHAVKENLPLDLMSGEQFLEQESFSPDERRHGQELLSLIEEIYARLMIYRPLQNRYRKERQAFLRKHYPRLDWILYTAWPERLDDDPEKQKEVAKRKRDWKAWQGGGRGESQERRTS